MNWCLYLYLVLSETRLFVVVTRVFSAPILPYCDSTSARQPNEPCPAAAACLEGT